VDVITVIAFAHLKGEPGERVRALEAHVRKGLLGGKRHLDGVALVRLYPSQWNLGIETLVQRGLRLDLAEPHGLHRMGSEERLSNNRYQGQSPHGGRPLVLFWARIVADRRPWIYPDTKLLGDLFLRIYFKDTT
jgi:hypothetical protein